MVGASITLSVITIVVAFILGVFNTFPLDINIDEDYAVDESEDFDETAAEEAIKRIELSYNAIISDIASFQKDPDLERAEARKEAFTGFAQELVGKYQDLSDTLQADLDGLIEQANEEANSSQ